MRCVELARAAEAEGGDWREAINFVRGVAPHALAAHVGRPIARGSCGTRGRTGTFIGIACPEAALARLTHLRQTGRLQVHAGRVDSLQLEPAGVARPLATARGGRTYGARSSIASSTAPAPTTISPARGIRCCDRLLREGLAIPDAHGLGLRTGRHGAVIDAEGWPATNLHYVGPMLRADHWEATAATELAVHAQRLADHLCVSDRAVLTDRQPRARGRND